MTEVSIIVPIYNAEKHLGACIESILHQSYRNFELLLVNDGSRDKSGEICKTYAQQDERIVLIEQENAGVSAARNRGIDRATGDYIIFVDSDDIIPIDYVGNMINAPKEFGADYFVISAVEIISPNQAVSEQVFQYGTGKICTGEKCDIIKMFNASFLNSPCNKLYLKKDLIKNKVRMKEGMSIAEDLLFNVQYWRKASFTKFVVLNENRYGYVRTGEVSLDNKFHPTYYESHVLAFSELEKCSKLYNVRDEEMDIMLRRYYSIIERSLDNTLHNECQLKWWQKWHKNDIILKDDLFVRALRIRKNELSRGRYLAYQSGCFAVVWAYNKWSAFRNRYK